MFIPGSRNAVDHTHPRDSDSLRVRRRGWLGSLPCAHFRERLGLKTTAWNGFSALTEGEFSQAAIDDFNGGAPGADPFDPANTTIADPQTNELNEG